MKPQFILLVFCLAVGTTVGQNRKFGPESVEYKAALKLASDYEALTATNIPTRPVLPAAAVNEIGQDTFRVTVRKVDGWYDTRLPYVPCCKYEIRRTDANGGKYEFVVGDNVQWYDAGFNNPQVLDSGEFGSIKLRVNHDSPFDWMTFEISRREPLIGACYTPRFAQIPAGRTICDVPVIQIGDDTNPLLQGLNTIAPLFGAQPVRTPARVMRLSVCAGASTRQRQEAYTNIIQSTTAPVIFTAFNASPDPEQNCARERELSDGRMLGSMEDYELGTIRGSCEKIGKTIERRTPAPVPTGRPSSIPRTLEQSIFIPLRVLSTSGLQIDLSGRVQDLKNEFEAACKNRFPEMSIKLDGSPIGDGEITNSGYNYQSKAISGLPAERFVTGGCAKNPHLHISVLICGTKIKEQDVQCWRDR